MTDAAPAIEALGDSALILHWESRIDAALNARVHALAARIAAERPHWLVDLVPAYASLALFFDRHAFAIDEDPRQRATQWLQQMLGAFASSDQSDSPAPLRQIDIAVHYGGEDGPDLADVAAVAGCSELEAIEMHMAGNYRVAMLGFAPGFPYLLGLNPRLHVSRLAQPRQRVAAGSVAIGGAQTGIYPRSSPGGWRVIGRTDVDLFDCRRAAPSLLLPGDRVRFVRADAG